MGGACQIFGGCIIGFNGVSLNCARGTNIQRVVCYNILDGTKGVQL